MKNKIMTILLLSQASMMLSIGMITNNSNLPINVVMYGYNYKAATPATANQPGRSAQGRLNSPGTSIIAPGNNVNFTQGTVYIDVFSGNGTQPGIHMAVSANNSYTINPDSPVYTVTQD